MATVSASLSNIDTQAIALTLELAGITTAILLVLATPLALWLTYSPSRWRRPIAAIVALPLVLPPTVLGFYLLLLLGPHGPIGQFTQSIGLGTLPFTFPGLVVASVIYSLPFAVQPLQTAFAGMGTQAMEAAATLRAGPLDRFFAVILPLAKPGFITAGLLTFAHTIGEFGVVLMIGGNIPGQTRVLSIALFNHVEATEYVEAHWLAGGMVVFSFVILLALQYLATHRNASRQRDSMPRTIGWAN